MGKVDSSLKKILSIKMSLPIHVSPWQILSNVTIHPVLMLALSGFCMHVISDDNGEFSAWLSTNFEVLC
jgi:hypothetical protein